MEMNAEQRAAMRKLAEEATPVAYQSTRNGFIAKENKNPEYNTPLYKFDPPIILKLLDYIETLEKDAHMWNMARKYLVNEGIELWISEMQLREQGETK